MREITVRPETSPSYLKRLRDGVLADPLESEAFKVDFRKAFNLEETRAAEGTWAQLSERRYFIVSVDGAEYLLIGVNSRTLDLSSVGRIAPRRAGWAALCVRAFIEGTLIRLCQEGKKDYFCSAPETVAGREMLERLCPPKGVARVEPGGGSADGFKVAWTFHLVDPPAAW